MEFDQALGCHGVVLPSENPARDAKAWSAALQLPVLRHSRDEVVLGFGPELFVSLVRKHGAAASPPPPPVIHLAVKGPRARKAQADAMGGDGVPYTFSGAQLVVREFLRAPEGRWKQRRRPQRTRRSPSSD